jgi:uncharacterized protein YecE (DUF72 family)
VILIGTSGWQYAHWRERFYPPGVPQSRWLEYYAEAFPTVEVNNAFYRLPERTTFAAWRERTPADFVVAVKVSRYLTHIKRLREPQEPVARFVERATALGSKLGPVLLQLPPTMRADPDALDAALSCFPARMRVAVEPRHPSWWTDRVREVLTARGAALCWADRHSRPVTPLWRTADFGYLRMHEGRAQPRPRYGRSALDTWVRRIASTYGSGDVFVYFNNDGRGAALVDADAFARRAARRGLDIAELAGPLGVERTRPAPDREGKVRDTAQAAAKLGDGEHDLGIRCDLLACGRALLGDLPVAEDLHRVRRVVAAHEGDLREALVTQHGVRLRAGLADHIGHLDGGRLTRGLAGRRLRGGRRRRRGRLCGRFGGGRRR